MTSIIRRQHSKGFYTPITLLSLDGRIKDTTTAQIDSRSTRSLIGRQFAKRLGLHIAPLTLPLEVEGCNKTIVDHIDGRVEVRLGINDHRKRMTLWVMNLVDDVSILLGFD